MGLSSGDIGLTGQARDLYMDTQPHPLRLSSLPASPAVTVQWVSQEGEEERDSVCVSVCVNVGMASSLKWEHPHREGAAESGGPGAPTGSCLVSSQERQVPI